MSDSINDFAGLSRIVALILTSALVACSPFPVLNGFGTDSTYRNLSTLRYGHTPRQQLDIYQPAVSDNSVVVIFFMVAAGAPTLALAERITTLGGQAQAHIYPDKGHAGLLLIFTRFGATPILHDTLGFMGLGRRADSLLPAPALGNSP